MYIYTAVPLYYQTDDKKFSLYKPAGISVNERRVEKGLLPGRLYVKRQDKIKSVWELQKTLNRQLKEDLSSNRPENLKKTLINIVQESFAEPRGGSLEGLSETANILVKETIKESDIVNNFLNVSYKNYTTVLHSINVMVLALGYAAYEKYSLAEKKILGLSALLHDVGKIKITAELFTAPKKLSDDEFKMMQTHTVLGYQILSNCKFGNPEIKLCALQHHEKLDGSGYPGGLKQFSKQAQIIGLIDSYEALTNDDRPYRNVLAPLKALTILKDDVEQGKFDKKIFENFAYSLL